MSTKEEEDIIKNLQNNPWSEKQFSDQLIQWISLKTGNKKYLNDKKACVEFLKNGYQAAKIKISGNTLQSWIFGTNRPFFKKDSRQEMYQLCFVLCLTFEEVSEFFHFVYLDQDFNCRDITEAVYCYAFSHQLTYPDTKNLLKKVNEILSSDSFDLLNPNEIPHTFTTEIKEDISTLKTEEDFLIYIQENKKDFLEYHRTAQKELEKLLTCIRGSEKDRIYINECRKKKKKPRLEKLDGLAVKEYISYYVLEDSLKGIHFSSNSFMLEQILGKPKREGNISFAKNTKFVKLLCLNFPNNQILSNILSKKKVSSDAIRKLLILLHFYKFWINDYKKYKELETNPTTMYEKKVKRMLLQCGYGELFSQNPYDYLFLQCAKLDDPLNSFRCIIDLDFDKF